MVPVTQLTTETDAPTLTAAGEVVHEADSPDAPWWRDAVIYQVYPRSWADADGDGMGDLPGITARLPYLRDLGVDAVWLSPFYVSPMNDAGYDVADYRDIDPRFGSLADADTMVATAHDLGLKVLVDLVPNHTSSEHAWFRAALAAGPGSPERERYMFRDGRGAERRGAAEQLALGLRRPRLDPRHRGRRHPRPVVPAHLRRHPARPELGAPRGRGRVPRHPAVLVRPGRRRLPGRRRPRPGQARGAARLARQGRPLRRGRRRRRAHRRGPRRRAAALHRRRGARPHRHRCGADVGPGRRARDLPRLAPGARLLRPARPHPVRRGLGRPGAPPGPLRAPRRDAPGVQLRLPRRPLGRHGPAHRHRGLAALQRRRSAPRPPGCCPTTTSCGTPPGWVSTSRSRDPTASGPTTRSRMPCSACAGRAPPPR